MIGLRFNSLARSLLASCHSLVNVFGGGAATKTTQKKKEIWMSKLESLFFPSKKALVTYQIAV